MIHILSRRVLLTFVFIAAAIAAEAQSVALSRSVRTVDFNSPSVGRTMKYHILLPSKYESSTDRYPVLYLLHGLTQNYTIWATQNGSPFYSGLYDDLIVVALDGGNSWYVNWGRSEGGQKNNWDDAIIKDAIGHVDANFRTIARREARAMSGLSMGGYGSITLGLRHPEMFISVGTTSGALEHGRQAARRLRGQTGGQGRGNAPAAATTTTTGRGNSAAEQAAAAERRRAPNPAIGIAGFSSQEERSPLGQEFVTAEQADAYDPFTLIQKVAKEQLPHIYIDCGTDDRLIAGARELAQILMEKNIPFDYMQQPGAHNSAYWIRSMGRIIAVQYEVMQRAMGKRPMPNAAGAR